MGCGGSDEEKKSSGPSTFLLIQHDFAEDKAEEWWANTQKVMGDAEALKAMTDAANAAGFHNHAFMPVSQTKAFCIWEVTSLTVVRAFRRARATSTKKHMRETNSCHQTRTPYQLPPRLVASPQLEALRATDFPGARGRPRPARASRT